MLKPKHTIRKKITVLLLTMVMTAMLLTGAVSLWSLYSMKKVSDKSRNSLGQTAAADSEEALKEMAGAHLLSISVEKAAYIEEKFHNIISCLYGISHTAGDIYKNPHNYPDREVPLPVKESHELAVQLLWSEKLMGTDIKSVQLPNPTPEQKAELLKLGNIQDMLVQYNANNDMISSTYLATTSGWMLQADYIAYSKYSENSDLPDFYEADTRQWYQEALLSEDGEVVYTDVIKDIHEGRDCIVCATPVYLNGKIVAVAGVGSYLDVINDAVLDTAIGESGYAFLINDSGCIMVSGAESGETSVQDEASDDLRNSRNEALADVSEKMLAGESGLEKLYIDDREVYLAYAPLEELGWSFVTVVDVEEIVAPAKESQYEILALTDAVTKQQNDSIKSTQMLFIIIIMGMSVLIIIVGILFSGKLTKPIRKLTGEVAQIDGGNLDKRVDITTGDEVEELGHAFNNMTSQLCAYIKNISVITAEKERIHTEIQVASRIQADMLPNAKEAFPEHTEFSLHASMTPAKGVGGDFYDFFMPDNEHLVLVIADVSGKGVPAALFMVVSRTLIRSRIMSEMEAEIKLSDIVEKINNVLCANNNNGMFVTAWIGILTLSTGNLTFVNAGHCHPLIHHRDGRCVFETSHGGFVLAGMEGMSYKQSNIQLNRGDTLLLYTDGVTEATNIKNELYGENRLKSAVSHSSFSTPEELLKTVWQEVVEFQKGTEQFDDITMLAVTYNGEVFAEKTGRPCMEQINEYSAFVGNFLTKKGVSIKTIFKILMAADEIYSNICYYSGATEIKIGVGVEKNTVTVYFEDNGIPYNPLKKPDPDVDELLELRKTGGLGIYLVKKTMDDVKYEYLNGRNHFAITKNA